MFIVSYKRRGGTANYREWFKNKASAWHRFYSLSDRVFERINIVFWR